jgi:hypothetical protein
MYNLNDVAIREHQLASDPPQGPEATERHEQERRALEARKPPARELASWYRDRHQAKHPAAPTLASVRFLAIWHPVGSEIATPDGHWRRRPVEEIPKDRVSVIFRRNFGGS